MRNAFRILTLALGAAALIACQRAQPQRDNATSTDDNVVRGEFPANADIETLPPDESSVDSNGELAAGDDNPDVNDVRNSH